MIRLNKKIALQALDCTSQPLLIVDAQKSDLPVVYVNTSFETLTGLDAGDVIGNRLDELVARGRAPEWTGKFRADGDEDSEQTWRLKGGRELRVCVRRSPLFERPGRPSFWLLTVLGRVDGEGAGGEAALRDALHDARRKLKRLERTDPATGIPNESAFDETLHRDWAIARREQRRIGVVVFQVDYLEAYREKLGRHATNSVLRKIAHAISGSLRRAGDFGARLGDDRFAVIIGSADDTQARDFAARAVKNVNNLAIPHPKSPVARHITISFGAASETPEWSSTYNRLLETALQRLGENRPRTPAGEAETFLGTRADLVRLSR